MGFTHWIGFFLIAVGTLSSPAAKTTGKRKHRPGTPSRGGHGNGPKGGCGGSQGDARKAHSPSVATGGEGGVNTKIPGRESLSCGSDGEEGWMKNPSAELTPVGKGKS